ncbi:HK97 gp10 family phage protein [Limosilactobacillus sp. RRLNB_1_1]|uniref:HK97 gp10 family phage protein n=2 Tax=Limosilactobacillus albertensis TaxID=2759752 RepID=A0A7W3TU12_9LACO|nr:HK97-gp10 family putative phage morphogenesis protein [Limosilactobacillus albertensis]MBB1070686.1 HK97 gp10 family phage protein [Limosilactobacillus albertensis]
MAVTGEAELIANLQKLEKTEEKKARQATRDGAQVFQDKLKQYTPVAKTGDHSGKPPLKDHTKHGNLKTAGGDYSVDVGYDKDKGWIAHFPNSGTSKQHPQHFIEKAQNASKKEILAKYIEDLQV